MQENGELYPRDFENFPNPFSHFTVPKERGTSADRNSRRHCGHGGVVSHRKGLRLYHWPDDHN